MTLGLSLALLAGAAAAAPAPTAAPGPAPAAVARKAPELPGERVEFQTRDGWTLGGKYQPAAEGELTFVLLHDQKGRHQDWRRLAAGLTRMGIGYLAFDLRGHGLSQRPPEGQPKDWRQFKADKTQNDWDNMREDVAGAVEFLKGRGVPAEQVALGGSDVGASVALKYAAVHPETPMVFLLSPGMSYRNVATVNAMRLYKDRPILMVIGDADKTAKEGEILAVFARNAAGPENVSLHHVPRGHGTQLLASRGVVERILAWIDNPISAPDLAPPDEPEPAPAGTDGLPSEQQMDRSFGQNAVE